MLGVERIIVVPAAFIIRNVSDPCHAERSEASLQFVSVTPGGKNKTAEILRPPKNGGLRMTGLRDSPPPKNGGLRMTGLERWAPQGHIEPDSWWSGTLQHVMLIPQSREKHLCSLPVSDWVEKATAEILRPPKNGGLRMTGVEGRARQGHAGPFS